ncbi:MAG: C4-dicarboxylate ABC transporter permease, partial [Rhodobacteraceae bacterium]|nr:C4-dicarboxylate ABC transporter permease [Paracoccaceae bacterium]
LQLIALFIVGVTPQLVNYLPNRVSFLSETAPPPRNPKLQYCLEKFVGEELEANGATLAAIKAAQGLDLGALPKNIAKDLAGGFAGAEAGVAALQAAFAAEAEVDAAAPVYRPQLAVVRNIQKQIREAEAKAKDISRQLGRARGDDHEAGRPALEAEIAGYKTEAERLKAEIPETWADAYKTFSVLTKTEDKARATYRRQADKSWESAETVLAMLDATPAMAALGDKLRDLRADVETGDPEVSEGLVNDLTREFRDVAGSDDVESALSKVRRELKSSSPDIDKALAEYDKAISAYDAQMVWRAAAETDIRAGLVAFLDGIRGTLGARSQRDLNRKQALYLAACTAGHQDLSLHF